ncbi:MAG TPA: response regulator [Lacunisphaera sp.]|nr:response regulator [Lacunisphaera sp.]
MGPWHSFQPITVLIAEDSDLDYGLLEHALAETKVNIQARRATDGVTVLKYLRGEGAFADRLAHPFPHIIVVDLKMPSMSGFDVLEWIRDNPGYRVIPTVVLSTSAEASDVQRAYELGANTYFTKPSHLKDLRAMCVHLAAYWERAEIPPRRQPNGELHRRFA